MQTLHLYISPSGDDRNSGGENAPFATFARAKQALADRTPGQKAVVHVGKGSYYLDKPLMLTESDVAWRAENAVLTGAQHIANPTITRYDDHLYCLKLTPGLCIDGFLIDGKPQIMARYPNFDPSQPLSGSASMADIKERSRRWQHPETGYVRALHQYLWGGNSFVITGKDETAPHGLKLRWVGDNNRGCGIYPKDHAMLVENIFEELDAPNEWFYDQESGLLYFYPEQENAPESREYAIVTNAGLLTVSGAKNVTLSGFDFAHTARTLFTGSYVPLLRSDWCVVREGCLHLRDAEDVTIEHCTFQDIGGHAMLLDGHNARITIRDNEIADIGACGILVAGQPDSCREPSFWDKTPVPDTDEWYVHKTDITDTAPGPIREHYPKDCVIEQNHIHNIGIYEKQSSHIAISTASGIRMLHNTLHFGPRAGINIGDGSFGGHEIAYNDIFDMQRETDDHGMFNSWGRDRYWSLHGFDGNGNRGREKAPFALLDAVHTTEIHHNRIHFSHRLDGGATFGIDLDDGSSNYDIHHNLCLGMGVKLREGFSRRVYNNILLGASVNLHCVFADASDAIERNIIVSDTPYQLALADNERFADSGDTIDYNCLTRDAALPDFWAKRGYDAHSVRLDPQFADPAHNDYTVQNQTLLSAIGFENFPMVGFGKDGCAYQSPILNTDTVKCEKVQQICWEGAVLSDLTQALMSSTAAGSMEGVCILALPENCAAAGLGLRLNDVLQAVGGVPILHTGQFAALWERFKAQSPLTFTLTRNQQKITLTIR